MRINLPWRMTLLGPGITLNENISIDIEQFLNVMHYTELTVFKEGDILIRSVFQINQDLIQLFFEFWKR